MLGSPGLLWNTKDEKDHWVKPRIISEKRIKMVIGVWLGVEMFSSIQEMIYFGPSHCGA